MARRMLYHLDHGGRVFEGDEKPPGRGWVDSPGKLPRGNALVKDRPKRRRKR